MAVRIVARIMHVPSRPAPIEVVNKLWRFTPLILTDHKMRGPWWNARRCWLSGASDTQASHVLVVQDDAVVLSVAEMEAAVSARPESIISFFAHHGIGAGVPFSWLDFERGCWGVALCLPRQWALDFVNWVDHHGPPTDKDDLLLMYWSAATGRLISATNPSLVDHRADLPSTVGPRSGSSTFRATNPYVGQRILWDTAPVIIKVENGFSPLVKLEWADPSCGACNGTGLYGGNTSRNFVCHCVMAEFKRRYAA